METQTGSRNLLSESRQEEANIAAHVRDLREELQELHDGLGRLHTDDGDRMSALMFQFIAARITEIARSLTELADRASKQIE